MIPESVIGQPFYCKTCDAGWNEYGACEETDCKLETIEEAQARALADRMKENDSE